MNLQVAVANLTDCLKELTLEIGVDDVQTEYDKAYETYARHAKVPGFRQGKVPKAVVKQRFAKDIKGEVINQLVPHALGHAMEEQKLRVIGSPEVNPDEIVLVEGATLKFTARVTVVPDYELKNYSGLKLTKRVARIKDESVEIVMADLRDRAAQLVPVEDRPSQTGDFVSVNLVGKFIAPVEEEDLTTEDLVIELGGEGVQTDFNEHLSGLKEGEVKNFTVVYPADFPSQGLAGKTLEFTATINSVKFKELPELDDDFAQEIAEEYKEEYQTLAAMRERIRENLQERAEQDAEIGLRDDLLEAIAKEYDFTLPEPLVERQANTRLQEFVQRLMRSGVSPQAAQNINWAERQTEERQRAESDVRIALLLGSISEAEKVEVTREDLDQEIERIAESVGQSPEEVEARLTKDDSLSSIENRLRSEKVIDLLISKSEVTVEEFDDIPATEQPADEVSTQNSGDDKIDGAGESA